MSGHDSDSSMSDEDELGQSTDILLGYASKDPTNDAVSRLGGEPQWLDPDLPASYAYSRCNSCTNPMPLLLQLSADLPGRYPTHERRLYMWACRAKRCRRKPGCVRALRGVRVHGDVEKESQKQAGAGAQYAQGQVNEGQDLGSALFGGSAGSASSSSNGNPFSAAKGGPSASSNPFAAKPESKAIAGKEGAQDSSNKTQDLSSTFAQKARITDPASDGLPHPVTNTTSQPKPVNFEKWPTDTATKAKPYPHYYLEAEYEYLASTDSLDFQRKVNSASHAAFMDIDDPKGATSKSGREEEMPDDAIDRTFQHFADVLSQNPEQVLRYHFDGKPLLTRHDDDVGKAISSPHEDISNGTSKVATVTLHSGNSGSGSKLPTCSHCGAKCVFEYQLTPGAIAALEEEEDLAILLEEGMDWGTIVVASCEQDCVDDEAKAGSTSFREQWVGVQWEEVVERGPSGKGGPGG